MTRRRTIDDHPTIVAARQRRADTRPSEPLDAQWLRDLVLEAGADDVGFVEIDRPEIADQRDDLSAALPGVQVLISFVCKMNRENIKTPARSVANLEFHHTGDHSDEVGRRIAGKLEAIGVRAINPAMGFPMEMDKFPSKTWVVSHKPVAEAAGLGRMGIHRNVIHPKFGNFILLGTVLMDAKVSQYSRPVDYNPCLECKLCVAACPTGAIAPDGHFDFSACYTHNYREFMGGFGDWVGQVADSKNRRLPNQGRRRRDRIGMAEPILRPNCKAAYCMSVCPAGDDVIGAWMDDRKSHVADVVRPLQRKEETVYVMKGSDAEEYVARRFPDKRTKQVGQSLRANSIEGLIQGLPLIFQRGQTKDFFATYHFSFTGAESRQFTVRIQDRETKGHRRASRRTLQLDSAAHQCPRQR